MPALLFDWDNTIIDSFSWSDVYVIKMLEDFLGKEVPRSLFRKYVNNGWVEAVQAVAKELQIKKDLTEVEDFVTKGRKKKTESLCTILPGVLKNLQSAKSKGIKIALCSNNTRADLEAMLKLHELETYFDLIVGEDEVAKNKPAPDMFLRATEVFKLNPQDCLVIEDSITGIRAAKAANIPVFAVGTGTYKPEDILRFEPEFFSEDLSEVNLIELFN